MNFFLSYLNPQTASVDTEIIIAQINLYVENNLIRFF